MPVGISSPARNLFLLGSTGEQTVTNFFKAVDLSSSTDGVFLPEAFKYRYGDDSYTIGGTASDPQSKRFGWIENRTYNPETAASTQVWDDRIESSVPAQSVFLRSIIFDQAGRIIVVGHGGGTCWIRRYSSAGVLDWQASTFTGEARYLGVAHDGLAYYVCGHTGPGDDDSAIAYVEKFDDQGNPIWGKAAFFEYDDVLLESIAIADDGNILAVGRIDDNDGQKGFMVKLDSQTGDVLWDKTITAPKKFNQFLTLKESVGLEKIYADGNGQFYVAGRVISTRSGSLSSRGILIKFDTEGNIIWQKETPLDATKSIEFFDVSAETDTEQVIVLGRYYDGIANDEMGILSKYTKNGTLLWRRTIKSSRESSDKFSTAVNPPVLDADSSFYYLLFRDESIDTLAGEPDRYTFGKVSTSGNGLGDFQYADSTGETIDYEIVNIDSNIGILQDGSVTNSVSDLRSTPYSAEKIVFDDYATNIAGKKRKVSEGLQSFMYSGSPAVRPQDFETREFTTDGYGVPPQKNYIGLSESLQSTSTSNTGTTNNTWSRQTTNVTTTANNLSNPLGVGSGAEKYNISATTGRRLEYGVPSGVFVAGRTYTYSWWMKAITIDARWNFQALNAGSSNNSIRIADRYGNILENVSTTNTTNYTPKDTEWHRVVWTFTANNTTGSPIGGYNDNSETGDLWYLWGAQLVDGSNPLPYYRNYNGSPENADGTEHAPSIVDGAYEFDGSEILQIGPVPEIVDEFTVEIWFKSDTHSNWQNPIDCNYGSQDLLGNGLANSGNIGPRLEINASGTFAWVFGSTLAANDPFFSLPAGSGSTGVWYHSVITYGGGGATDGNSYLNGEFVSQSSQNVAGTAGWVGEFRNVILGRGFTLATRYFDGQIGEVRIYPRALTATQVFQNYNATKEEYTGVRANTTPRLSVSPIVIDSDLLLNYDFGNGSCIDTSSTVSTSTYETIIDDATTNGAAFGDGQCVAAGYGKVVVGARGEDCTIPGYTYTAGGKAYIYNATTGALEATLIASDISGNDWNFGNAVAICGCSGKIAVTSNSALYLYDADGTNEIIIDSNSTLPISPPGGNTFGNGLAISGNRVWVSDNNVPQGSSYSGTVYCFNAETGAFLYELRPKDIFGNFSAYGLRIAAGGGKLAIGADSITHPVTGRSNTGRVYLYNVDGTEEKIIEPDALTTSALFGQGGLAIDHGMLIVGASRQQRVENPLELGSGEVYVFDLNGELKFSIRPSDDPADEDSDAMGFGDTVAISSDRIIVGAQYYVGNPGGVAGRAYQFTHKGKELQAWTGGGTGANASNFGSSMDASGGTLVIGAGAGSPDASGRAYIYPLTNTPSGTISNLASRSFPGTINGATFNSAGYFEFDGTDDYIQSSSVMAPGSADFSVIMWYKITSTAGRGGLFERAASSPFSGWVLGQGGDNNWACSVRDSSNNNAAFQYTFPTVGDWTCDAFTWNTSTQTLTPYRNGANAGTATNSGTVGSLDGNTRYPMVIGGRLDSNLAQYKPMECGEVQMYSKVLTAAEVLQNFNATRGKYGV